MRVTITPRRADVLPGIPLTVAVTISNTDTVIGGYTIRVLGADPGWVELDAEQISLFPDESRTIIARITVPKGIAAGMRRIAVQVRELTPPEDSTVAEIDLTVPAAQGVQVRMDPLAVTAGRRANFSVLVENTGNTIVGGRLAGDDPESKVHFDFQPERLSLAPGEHAVVDLKAKARRHFMGSPTIRMLSIYVDDPPAEPFFNSPEPPEQDPARDEREALALGTFVQRPVLSRGPIALVGLLAAITVFALVITLALSRLVGQSAADRDLALQVAAARDSSATTGSSSVSGTVRLLTSGAAVRGVAVNAFAATDDTTPVATTATDAKGAYTISNLPAGNYKISFRGAGFVELWYPGAATSADATTLTLKERQSQAGIDAVLGGIPATISGTVVGDDVSAATLFLESADSTTSGTTTAQTGSTTQTTPGVVTPPDNGEAVVRTVPIGADGSFTLTDVPSPTVYDLVVTKTGYATSTQRIDIGAGETRAGVEIRLQQGDGVISGHVNSAAGGLGGVTLTATSGQSVASTVSLTTDDVGSFTLRSLPTPASFTIVASEAGYASQTLTLSLSSGQKLTGVVITLGQSSGSISGTVKTSADGAPAPGVSVTITNGQLTVQTVTASGQGGAAVGSWSASGLAVPGTYTITFSRSDLASQTVSVALDAAGNITPGSQGATVTAAGLSTSMVSSTGVVSGVVQQYTSAARTASNPLGEATVTLASGNSSYTVTSASVPTAGAFEFDSVPPGTYTLTGSAGSGVSPSSQVVIVSAGSTVHATVLLDIPAAIYGKVVGTDPAATPRSGWTVVLYVATQYPQVVTASATTDEGGLFNFTGIAAGNYIVEVRPTPSSQPVASQTVTLTPSQQLGSPTTPGITIQADPNG